MTAATSPWGTKPLGDLVDTSPTSTPSQGLVNARRRLASLEQSALDVNFHADASVPLDELIEDISAGKSFGSTNTPARYDEWGIIKASAMTWGEFKPDENKAAPADRVDPRFENREGDLLVSRANTSDYVGASVLLGPVRSRLLLSDKSLRVTPNNRARPDWLWRALQAPSARRQISALATGTKDSCATGSPSSRSACWRGPRPDQIGIPAVLNAREAPRGASGRDAGEHDQLSTSFS